MYRTDKQFMKNPATAPQRIYIGALPKTVVAGDLEEKFGNHGKILGLSIQNGFAFIQFETDQQAQAAIKSENGSQLHGKRIVVKQAVDKSTKSNFPPQQQQQQNKFPGRNQYPNQGKPPMGDSPKNQKPESFPPANNDEPPPVTEVDRNDQSHSQDEMQTSQDDPKFSSMEEEALHFEPPASHFLERPPRYDEPPGRFSEPSSRFNEPPGRFNEMPPGRFNEPPGRFDDRRFDDRPPFDDSPGMRDGPRFDRGGRKGRGRGRGGGSGGGRDMREDRFPPPPHDQFRDKPPFFANRDEPVFVPSNFNPPPPILERPERNDCEIIVVAKALTEYAEYIEERLKQLGLIVDLLFPNEDVPIGKVLANISSRGCLFAILVMPQNEEHRSLTLNILHGVPQEHRNMPIEDALILITRNFENYMRGEPPTSDPPAGSKMNLTDRHPISVQMLLNLLAENRQINSVQYEKIIKYLQEKLELQVEYEKAEGIEMTSEGETTKQAELQNRILNILNKSGDGPASAPQPAPPKPASGVAPSPLLKDPTVQKALDSLMLGDMFKTMGAAS